MGSKEIECENEQLNDFYAENTVFVAVGKQVKESESVLLWAAQKFARKKRICILHVHQPANLVTFFDGKLTTSKLKQRAIKAFRELDVQKLHKLINQYVLLLSHTGVHADRLWIEMDNTEEGIVKMIVQHGIKWLVMGGAADKHYTKGMAELKSRKAIFICEQAPVSCHIWFTCKGKLIYTREDRGNAPGVNFSLAPSLNSNVARRESGHFRSDNLGADLDKKSLDSDAMVEEAKHVRFGDSGSNISLEPQPQSPYSYEVTEEGKLVTVDDSGADTLSVDSDAVSEETELQSLDPDAVIEEAEHVRVGDSDTDSLSLDSNGASEDSEDTKIVRVIDTHGSPPRLTFRERGSILRACSVDLDSHAQNSMVLSSSQNFLASSGCVNTEEEGHEFVGRKKILTFRSSFNSALFEGKLVRKTRLGTPREIHDRLERAMSDAENLKQMAFKASVERWKAEEDAMDAKNKAEAAESKYTKELKQRKEIEEALKIQRQEQGRMKDEHETYLRELAMVQDQCCDLKNHIRESDLAVKELEEKIISAVNLLISFRSQRDQLQLERDNAVQETETLRRLREERIAILSGPQFSRFTLMEIGEATCSFDPSKRIGDGRYGSIYQGILHHVEVAIKMLPNDGSQGQSRFEHEVEVVSRVRHPNIVTLIGICPEARCVVYEYLEKGSLQDQLACRGKTSPLKWQIRVRIAKELCSTLIFLHTNNPPILHGNLKPSKVLLNANYISKVSDLGIFRLIPQNQIQFNKKFYYNDTTQDCASVYVDPVYIETGVFAPDSDVYAFGVILLQLLTSRPASGIVKHVKGALEKDMFDTVLDFSAGNWPIYQAKILAELALRCCHRNRSNRPDLASEVWSVLEALRNSCDAQAYCLKEEIRRPPPYFLCPIYQEVMKNPCTAADGFTYEEDAIRGWLDSGRKTSPMTNLKLSSCDLIPNHALQYAIQDWLQRV